MVVPQITTPAELDALPYGAIVVCSDGVAGQIGVDQSSIASVRRVLRRANGNMQDLSYSGMFLPATLVYHPTRDLVAEAYAEGDAQAQQRFTDVIDASLVRVADGTWDAARFVEAMSDLVSTARSMRGEVS
ncbi:hypothetical protein EDD28_0042 [Salana multivorans]|uniref:Uncharacterized protein n=1 Tax=Salana multivorans TaxID=120377 RepID=A0A3N2D6T5_9MICO|nr:hypothetical protein [Salana multivorans]ROR95489.1 hypothetical protein EDD28_0042 [Salana multivorans]